eukprot:scaffold18702_cov54-Phaeocystis_antarctica.AAC.2
MEASILLFYPILFDRGCYPCTQAVNLHIQVVTLTLALTLNARWSSSETGSACPTTQAACSS